MFFLFSKVLAFVISPLTWIFTLLLFALFSKKPNRKRNLTIFAVIALFLFSNEFLINEAFSKWEFKAVQLNKTDKFDYAIVLGGFSSYDTSYSRMQLNDAGDRIWQALRLYKEKKVRKLFITGGSGSLLHQDIPEAEKVKTFLLSLEIPEKDIIIESLSRNTHENAKYTMEWLKKHDPKAKCILVTSASHMKRAFGCFRKYDQSVIAYPTNFRAESRKYDADILIVPDSKTLFEWDILLKEIVGYYIYKVVGYN
jgi:uncharacterized SAM-binding protein YcdF (DUF218 family)